MPAVRGQCRRDSAVKCNKGVAIQLTHPGWDECDYCRWTTPKRDARGQKGAVCT